MTSLTENGDLAYATSGSDCLDFFTRITRSAPASDYMAAFVKVWDENSTRACQLIFNLRDARGGKGEKLIPIVLMCFLRLRMSAEIYRQILEKFILFGCWKDALRIHEIAKKCCLEYNITFEPIELELLASQLKQDLEVVNSSNGESPRVAISLAAKWAPSEDSHFDQKPSRAAHHLMQLLEMKPQMYRQMLSRLRSHLNVLETLFCAQRFDEIDFSKIPSVAMKKMRLAFNRDENSAGVKLDARCALHQSYAKYLEDLIQGKTKVNTKTLQPHELVEEYMKRPDVDQLLESQWLDIRKRVAESGSFRNATAIVDVSGSMSGQPMVVAITLGLLVAECTSGPYHDTAITFSQTPEWINLKSSTLKERISEMSNASWSGNTNLQATFNLILRRAIAARLEPCNMIKTLFIFTDMQFDQCDRRSQSVLQYATIAFQKAGYIIPRIVCWNLRTSTAKTLPTTADHQGYCMVSGFSPELMKAILNAQEFSPEKIMTDVLDPYPQMENLPHIGEYSSKFASDLDKISKACIIKKGFKKPATSIVVY